MASHHAIATVTEALRRRLVRALAPEFQGDEKVLARRPENGDGQASHLVTAFLYRIVPNAALRNADLPTRTTDGREVRQRPRAALNLHYLLSFTGDETQLEPQRMLGRVVASLHSQAVLGTGDLAANPMDDNWYVPASIANDIESVRFCLEPLTLDDLSKVWSVFFQVPYRLSVAYEASVVLIESDIAVSEPLPVQAPGVDARPLRQPEIEHVVASAHRDALGNATGTLDIEVRGRRLRGEGTLVRFDQADPVAPERVGDTTLTVTGVALGAGVHGVQVIHEVNLGDPPVAHSAVESNVFAFVVRPTIAVRFVAAAPADPAKDAIEVTFTPAVAAGQRVRLLLNEFVDPIPADRPLRFHALDPETPPAATTPVLRFLRGDVAAGTYLVRAQVDGAESLVDVSGNDNGPPPQPRVVVP